MRLFSFCFKNQNIIDFYPGKRKKKPAPTLKNASESRMNQSFLTINVFGDINNTNELLQINY